MQKNGSVLPAAALIVSVLAALTSVPVIVVPLRILGLTPVVLVPVVSCPHARITISCPCYSSACSSSDRGRGVAGFCFIVSGPTTTPAASAPPDTAAGAATERAKSR